MAYDRDLRTADEITNQDTPGADVARYRVSHAKKWATRRVIILLVLSAATTTFVVLFLVVFHKPVAIAIAGFLVAHMLMHYDGGHSHGGGHEGKERAEETEADPTHRHG